MAVKSRLYFLLALVVVIVAASGYVVISLTPYGVATTPDSMSYLFAAESFAQGNGVSEPDFELASDSTVKPMTAWPPLYPVMLAPYLGGKSPDMAARYFNWTALCILALAFSWSLSRLGVPFLGLAGAFWMLIQAPILMVYAYAWSETLFMPLAMISFCFSLIYWQRVVCGECSEPHHSSLW